jgi:NitT/TauT family transport system permease protein/taurine transport system permease protein
MTKVLRVVPFLVMLFAWWLFTSGLHAVPAIRLPSPEGVLTYAREAAQQGVLFDAIKGSVLRFAAGLVLGLALGAPLALWVAISDRASEMIMPTAKFFQAISGVTWIPLAVLWFGISSSAAIFIIFNTTFFIIFYAVLTGVRGIEPRLGQSVRTLGGGFRSVLWNVLVPGSMPHVFTGMRVAVGYGWRALVAAEVIAAGRGLGVLIWDGQQELNTQKIFTGLLLIGLISFGMDRLLLRPIEKATIQRWGLSTKSS